MFDCPQPAATPETESPDLSPYKISIETKDGLIALEFINEENNTLYKGIFSHDFFKDKNEMFNSQEIDRIKKTMQKIVEDKKYYIYKYDDKIKTIWTFNAFDEDIQIELICIKSEKNEDESSIKSIISRLERLEQKNAELEMENKELKKIITDMTKNGGIIPCGVQKPSLDLETKLNELIEYNKKVEKEEIEFNRKGITKKIVRTLREIQMIHDWIYPKKERKFQLVFDPKDDGDKQDDFYRKITNKGPWIFVVETDKGKRFGGYCSFNHPGKKDEWLKDEKAFLFSLDNKKKYICINDETSVNCQAGIWFGFGGNIGIYDNFLTDKHYENFNLKCFDTTVKKELSGHSKFKLKSLEVYQVIDEEEAAAVNNN